MRRPRRPWSTAIRAADAGGRAAAAARRRLERGDRRRRLAGHRGPGDQRRPGVPAPPGRQRAAHRGGRRGLGRGGRGQPGRRASAGWSACPGSRAAPVPPRCRTSAPTAWRSPTCWSTSTSTTGPRTVVREHVPAAELGLGYRTSTLKGRADAVVLRVRFALPGGGDSAPIRYPELARALGVETGARVPARGRPGGGAAAAPRQGHGARRRRPGHLERRLVLHQPACCPRPTAPPRRRAGRPVRVG